MRLGIISNAYNTGISHIGWGFSEQFDSKTLIVDNKPFAKFPLRFKDHRITKEITQNDIDWLLDGIDCLFTIETPYEWSVYEQAKKKGIKTTLMPMYEWLDRSRPELKHVDLFICPSSSTFNQIQANKVQVPSEVPVDLTKFKPRKIAKAKTFLHNSGHGGVRNRNSTPEMVQAMDYVRSDVKLIVRSQYPLEEKPHPKIEYRVGNVENYWDLWHEGDVFILPGKYGVAYLGIQEAAATGMPVMFTDMEPFNEYIPKELLIPAEKVTRANLFRGQTEPTAELSPKTIAEAIDRVSEINLTEYNKYFLNLAHDWSWDVWRPKYLKFFQ